MRTDGEYPKLKLGFLWHEIQNNFIQFDRGVLYTSKALLTRPGFTIREFIEGKRIKHYKPIALVLLLATIYVLLYHYFKIDLSDGSSSFMQGVVDGGTKEANKNNIISYYGKIEKWANTHYSEQALMQIPFFALGTFIFFRKSGYNYAQFFVLITFITALGLLVRILLFPILLVFKNYQYYLLPVPQLVALIFSLWTCVQFFNTYSKLKVFSLVLLSYLFAFATGSLLLAISLFVYNFFVAKLF